MRERWQELFYTYSCTLRCNQILSIPECEGNAQFIALEHSSGARIYVVGCDSKESAFSYCFATPPKDDKGLAHIVEHAVFCGSQNYRLKEPFANLQKTSVSSFLNAMTYPDQTVYPAVSSFESDFLQLFRVYGDAVFRALLEPQAIAQEGVRQTQKNGLDGIVYNEMKSYYGDFETYVADCSLRSLFPDALRHPNSFDAGGNPQEIAAIDCRNYQEVRDFYHRHYRPANCRIILYGSIPQNNLEQILRYLDNELLCKQNLSPNDNNDRIKMSNMAFMALPKGQKLYQPVAATGKQSNAKQRSIMFSWVLPAQEYAQLSLEYRLMAELLLGHSGRF